MVPPGDDGFAQQGADLLSFALGRLPGSGDLDEFVEFQVYFDKTRKAAQAGQAIPYLRARLCEVFELLAEDLDRYLWHRDRFVLEVSLGEDPAEDEPHLVGHMRVGDGAEDEWFVLYLLRKLAAARADVACRVFDGDGEIILIEAALATPRWITPANAENRCWLRGGRVHLLPRPKPPETDAISCTAALDKLRSASIPTEAKQKVQDAICDRLKGYPKAACELARHMVRAVLPRHVARIFVAYPQLVGVALDHLPPPATEELRRLRREVDEAGGAEARVRFDCEDEETVCVGLQLTQCQYARLAGLKCKLPQRFTLKHWRAPAAEAQDQAAMILGATLCCGLESAYLQAPTSGTACLKWPNMKLPIASELLPASVPWWPDSSFSSYACALKSPMGSTSLQARRAYLQQDGIDDSFRQVFIKALHCQVLGRVDLASHWLDANDSDAFLQVSGEELDKELQARQAQFDAYDKHHHDKHHNADLGEDGDDSAEASAEADPEELQKQLASMGERISGLLNRDSCMEGLVASDHGSGTSAGRSRDDEADSDSDSNSNDPRGPLDPLGMEDEVDEDASSDEDEAVRGDDAKEAFEYMAELDEQLEGALDSGSPDFPVGASGTLPLTSKHVKVHGSESLDLDVHAMEHLLASFCSENHLDPGPASLLLGQLGMRDVARTGKATPRQAPKKQKENVVLLLDGMD